MTTDYPAKPMLADVRKQLKRPQREHLNAGIARAKREGWLDQVRGVQDLHALAHGCYFDSRYADHAEQFFEKGLTHQTGGFAGDPFELMPWQRDGLVRPLFGWRMPNGSRRFRSAFVLIPKKNGKSTTCGGLILYLLAAEPDPDDPRRTEPAQEVYSASTSQEVGSIVFREADKLVQGSPPLKKRLEVKSQTRRITYPATKSFFRVLPHKAKSAEGMIAGGVVMDEVHAMDSRELYAALRYAGASRRQPLFIEITTSGIDDPTRLWMQRRRFTRQVLDGDVIDITHLGLLYEADKDAEPDDVEQLRKANPSLGHTIDEADLLRQAKAAMAEGPAAVAEFKRYRMNIGVGAEQAWIAPETWDQGQEPFDLEGLRERPCYSGLDLAKVSDFAAHALLWPPAEGRADVDPWLAAFRFWIPRAAVLARSRMGDASYEAWEKAGLITVTDGNTTDHKRVRADVKADAERFNILRIGIDRNFEGWQFTDDLFNDDELPAVGVGQGWRSQDVPMQRIGTLVTEARINAGANPVMRWMIGNAIAKKVGPNQNLHLDRARAADKVDGVAALINAMYLAEVVDGDPSTPPTWDSCPLVVLD
ncbi:MAG: terminase TerL endonuclease subunit [Planctomycetota bacterium]